MQAMLYSVKRTVRPVMPWVNTLRPMAALLSGLITIAGFRLVEMTIAWWAVLAVFTGTMATMVENDWHDRYADRLKHKPLAYDNQTEFFRWRCTLWGLCLLLISRTSYDYPAMGVLLFGLVIVSWAYAYVYHRPLLPGILVALAYAAPVLLPVAEDISSVHSWYLFATIALTIYAIEITNDLDDVAIDRLGYKWTWPVAVGELHGRFVGSVCLFLAAAITMWASLLWLPIALIIFGAAISLSLGEAAARTARCIITAGLGIAVLTIIALAPF